MNNLAYTAGLGLPEFCNLLTRLHEDERGDNENLGRLLILALVLIPLIILIAIFGADIAKRARDAWDSLIGKEVKQQ
ncbi:MAG TPA: hypothetical protein VFY27_01005 [Woeseiaceae bacterium]|jgi:hypothetical protein|nr:hypothetical protein [Woeseiaceae bacterium]